jgi:hypothetical protein
VLADSQMPGKNGYDLCMSLKSDAAMSDVPVVILVGNGAPYDATKGAQVGADANLPKPWDTQIMLEKVTEVVAKGAQAKPGQAAPQPAAAASTPARSAPVAAAPSAAAATAAANASKEPPRSATIMGMPTIKMPPGVAPSVTASGTGAAGPQPTKTTAMAVPPMAPEAAATVPGAGGGLRPPAGKAPAAAVTAVPSPAATPSSAPIGGMNRGPMVAGTPTKRSALVERTLAKMASRLAEIAGVEPGSPELLALLKLSTEVVERIVWEVVPDLAEQIIRENLAELSAKHRS